MVATSSAKAPAPLVPAPLVHDVPFTDPASLLDALKGQPFLAFLDSAAPTPHLGRHSFLTFAPFALFSVRGGRAYWNGKALPDPPFIALEKKRARFAMASAGSDLPPFQGGALGYFSYEAGRLLEKLPLTCREDPNAWDILLPFYDLVLAVDHFPTDGSTPRARVFSSGWPHLGADRERHARERLSWFCDRLQEASRSQTERPARPSPPSPIRGWRSDVSRTAFEGSIERTRHYIRQGDIFQANITQRFSAPVPQTDQSSPLAYYHAMREHNAAPFAAYLDCGDHVIASSSPERFIILSETGEVETRPIKGTAPRDLTDPVRDRALADALAASEKDRAENVMITDLMRNDLSRVCQPGSIRVPQLCGLESYARVHHLVSTVTGRLQEPNGAVALLSATLPGGSITGAPKIRAMEIITELEDLPRGVYCGAIGYIGFDGAMDTNIAIRTVTFRDGMAHFNVGGGITILSDPAEEYEECLHKASALFHAFGTTLEAERQTLEQGPRPDEEQRP